jgi:hypothetical protein
MSENEHGDEAPATQVEAASLRPPIDMASRLRKARMQQRLCGQAAGLAMSMARRACRGSSAHEPPKRRL